MFEIFENYILPLADLNKEDLTQIRQLATFRKLRKGQYLMQEGDLCKYKTFVAKGLLKTYLRKDDGTEFIMRFSPENSWAIDPECFHNQTPSRYNIEAVEPTEVILWTRDDVLQLFATIPAFRQFSETQIAINMKAHHERILMNISYSSEEKYNDFIHNYPDIFRRVPLHMVASYLGVSRETLSRIRHAQQQQVKG
ncbi:MAG: Crp/Fnr family transcriptional regulator [Chitinophaga sp.]|uniref:Crp/Fnr family transcriptional regulator n=1 Tax=Chitinophaga sp. TaxID=1869181 RepID=UPI0025C1FEC2|nr:Crp/Fnr family transcriptional regulator [Chitinophaga sp.]MBV8253557.1 Crp/Fnr family transcriptional regulator [Chitinophaga sp.]